MFQGYLVLEFLAEVSWDWQNFSLRTCLKLIILALASSLGPAKILPTGLLTPFLNSSS